MPFKFFALFFVAFFLLVITFSKFSYAGCDDYEFSSGCVTNPDPPTSHCDYIGAQTYVYVNIGQYNTLACPNSNEVATYKSYCTPDCSVTRDAQGCPICPQPTYCQGGACVVNGSSGISCSAGCTRNVQCWTGTYCNSNDSCLTRDSITVTGPVEQTDAQICASVATTVDCSLDIDCKKPNLQCSNVATNPAIPVAGGTHSASASISNTGSANSGAFVASLYLDCNPDTSTCSSVGPSNTLSIVTGGDPVTTTFSNLSLTIPKTYTYYVKADPGNLVAEKIEIDNTCSASFNVCNANAPPAPTFTAPSCTSNPKPTWTRNTYSYSNYCLAIDRTKIIRSWNATDVVSNGELSSWTSPTDLATGAYTLQIGYSSNSGVNWGTLSATSQTQVDVSRPYANSMYPGPGYPTCVNNTMPTWQWGVANSGCLNSLDKTEVDVSWSATNTVYNTPTYQITPDSPFFLTPDGNFSVKVRFREAVNADQGDGGWGAWSPESYYIVDTTPPAITASTSDLQCSPTTSSIGSAFVESSLSNCLYFTIVPSMSTK